MNGHTDPRRSVAARFAAWASGAAHAVGRPWAFLLSLSVLVVWAITGPLFRWSDTWQLVINTGTSVITFLMVFLIQNTQNRDAAAIQAKLDELIRTSAAQNAYIGIERLTEEELDEIRKRCEARAKVLRSVADVAEAAANDKAQAAAERATS
ncbi:low affinity iron permease family protein [Falsiroseomonas sp. HW251]|uniref:low affinity iron permease family protein n=1 Tax=Falsiroseomonas sp. HW251 TaxID=3390998 RepID=UPI003D321866